MKIKRTSKGNVKLVISEEQALAIRDIVGKTNRTSRINAVDSFGGEWSIPQDNRLVEVYEALDDFYHGEY